MMNWRFHVQSTQSPAVINTMQLLARLAEAEGDLALLHEAPNGRAVIGVNPLITFTAWRHGIRCRVALETSPQIKQSNNPPIPTNAIDASEALKIWERVLSGVHFSGLSIPTEMFGWLGFISYELGVMLELPSLYMDDESPPLLHWQLFSQYFVYDSARDVWTLIVLDPHEPEKKKVGQIWSDMHRVLDAATDNSADDLTAVGCSEIIQTPDRGRFEENIRRCLDYIAAGDIYQANLAEHWILHSGIKPVQIYRNMIELSPSHYGAFVRFGIKNICSVSPELFVLRRGDKLVTQPIKGTRRRYLSDPSMDERERNDLLKSPKDRAELAMIVDLLRNDLGRVCIPGSVRVVDERRIERLPTVWHTSSRIEGVLRSGATSRWADLIAGVCPGGSITGVPKIRAMEIIAELEGQPRGVYCGNIGWIHPNGDGVLNIAIRTLHVNNGLARISAGSGIVAESNPQEEFAEVHAKAFALLKALEANLPAAISR
ncbi:MAG TPA: anthranilate synthase component I family protein [Phycisphaerae bacterium]|nr:anthranilate synthase component I family protein [Phycisphaerae bacterium]